MSGQSHLCAHCGLLVELVYIKGTGLQRPTPVWVNPFDNAAYSNLKGWHKHYVRGER